jgi:hypothetical protein
MSTSADTRRSAVAGFTLLEIMVTVGVVGLCILPLLQVREQSSVIAYKSGHLLRALTHGNRILTDRLLDPDSVEDETGVVEEDPVFGYVLTVEDYDLSTGRVVEEEDEQGFSQGSNFSQMSNFTTGQPADAAPTEEDVAGEDSQHRMRRVKLTISWPAAEGDGREELLLEGFLPRAVEEDDADSLLAPPK